MLLSIITYQRLSGRTDADFTAYLQNNYFPAATPADVDRIVRLHPADPAAGSPFGTGANNSIYPQYKRLAVFQGDFVSCLGAVDDDCRAWLCQG